MSSHLLLRDITATTIPTGEPCILPSGTAVDIAQTLGGSVTVRRDGGLYRIAREHADAIGGYAPDAGPENPVAEFSEPAVWAALKTCFDPEIPVNIVDLGLIYDLCIVSTPAGGRSVEVKMTLTAPGCGMGPMIAEDARQKIAALPAVESAQVNIVWEPAWTPQMMSADGRKVLGLE
jgi:probable FeS assembly SUF system protein SufT